MQTCLLYGKNSDLIVTEYNASGNLPRALNIFFKEMKKFFSVTRLLKSCIGGGARKEKEKKALKKSSKNIRYHC